MELRHRVLIKIWLFHCSPLPTYSSSMTPNSCLQQQAPSYSCMLPPASARGYDAALAYARAPPCPTAPQPSPHNGQFPNNGTSASTGECLVSSSKSLAASQQDSFRGPLPDNLRTWIAKNGKCTTLVLLKQFLTLLHQKTLQKRSFFNGTPKTVLLCVVLY